jgi:hypothetical protein
VAKFPLKFLTGTRKSCVTLRFVVQVITITKFQAYTLLTRATQVKTASNTVSTVESNASQPFIVITNDCQWEGSEGTLLKNEAFSDQVPLCTITTSLCSLFYPVILDRNTMASICEYFATPFFESHAPKPHTTNSSIVFVRFQLLKQ